MPKIINSEELKKKIDSHEQFVLVEVIGHDTYLEYHLPGAINVPVDDTFETEIQKAVPDKNQEAVVYCYDPECHASEKAYRRMEALGYTNVWEYAEGKDTWRDKGYPIVSEK